jgi:hypothetical protein
MAPRPSRIMMRREIIAMRASADILSVGPEGVVQFSSGLTEGWCMFLLVRIEGCCVSREKPSFLQFRNGGI